MRLYHGSETRKSSSQESSFPPSFGDLGAVKTSVSSLPPPWHLWRRDKKGFKISGRQRWGVVNGKPFLSLSRLRGKRRATTGLRDALVVVCARACGALRVRRVFGVCCAYTFLVFSLDILLHSYTDMHTHIHKQTQMQTNNQTDTHTHVTNKHTHWHAGTLVHKHRHAHTDTLTNTYFLRSKEFTQHKYATEQIIQDEYLNYDPS